MSEGAPLNVPFTVFERFAASDEQVLVHPGVNCNVEGVGEILKSESARKVDKMKSRKTKQ
jgi:hypothetical protein